MQRARGIKKRSKQDTGKIMSETRKRIIKKERARAVLDWTQKQR